MKTSKCLFLFLTLLLLMSCSNQPKETFRTTATPTTPFLDFDHPRLYEIAAGHTLVIREIVRTYRNAERAYAAIIVDTGDMIFREKMLLFRLEQAGPVLIYESDPYPYMSFNVVDEDPSWLIDNGSYYYYRSVMGGIYPIDENHLIVPFHMGNGGNCYDCSEMIVIGISENGTAKDITPRVPFTSKTFFDIHGNLNFEIVATRYYELDYGAISRAGSPYAFRLYAWDGNDFVDVSENGKDFFDQKTAEVISELEKTYGRPLQSHIVMPYLSQIFFNYESSGRVEYGWEQIKRLGDLRHWDVQATPPEEVQTYHEVFDLLEQRKTQPGTTPAPSLPK